MIKVFPVEDHPSDTGWASFLDLPCPFTPDRELNPPTRQLAALFLTTAAVFILIFGIAQGRNSPHYILASYLALNSICRAWDGFT